MGKNAIVGQSGGPTSVINASLAGVFESCKNRGADIVYGMCNGVAGLLEERVVDLSTLLTDDLDIELLKRTPSSFLGSCRYKLPDWRDDEAVYKKLFAILEKLNIGYFFYIGGNDSMDTIGKLAEYGERIQSDIRFMGVPKTIDNDLMVTDHTPGYGSAAKYIGVVMKEIIRDATVYGTKYVTVVEIMGRNAGWLTAAAALAKSDDCEGVDMICLPEVPFNVERFVEKPDLDTAKEYLASHRYLWNSGMFVWKTSSILANIQKLMPDIYEGLERIEAAVGTGSYASVLETEYHAFRSESIDFGVMEKAENIYTLPGSFGWDDVGNWLAVERINPTNEYGNYIEGDVITIGTERSTICGGKRLIAAVGIEDLIVVDTDDAVLICAKDSTQDVKKVIENLKICNRNQLV